MKISNMDNIPGLNNKSPLYKNIRTLCKFFGMHPEVQIFNKKKSPYRGVTYGNIISLYWCEYETYRSMFWVFCHELRHVMFNSRPRLYGRIEELDEIILALAGKRDPKKLSLKHHELSFYNLKPSEVMCDIFATEIVGRDYGERWLAKRIDRIEKKKKEKK